MVRWGEENSVPADVGAYLRSFGNVDRYITSTQEYLPVSHQGDDQADGSNDVARRAHAVAMQQLRNRTPQLVSGPQLYSSIETTRLMPCGCESIDALLTGGLRETTVTELAGETCSGKTQLCHLAAVKTALRGERVVYFDTTNAFCAPRALQLAETDDAKGVLTNIIVVRCHDIHALLASLDELAHQASMNAASTWPKLVVVDSVSAMLSPVIGALQHNQGHVLVAETARLLRHVAEALQCAVVVTNHVVGAGSFSSAGGRDNGAGGAASSSRTGGVTSSYKPALGEQWRSAAHVRVQLSRAGGDNICATLLAHPMKPPGLQAWFTVGSRIAPL